MREKICKEICPSCNTGENTVYKNKIQCYCKKCKKYFKPGTKRSEFSKNTARLINMLINLFTPFFAEKEISLRELQKKIEKRPLPPNIHAVKFRYTKMNNFNELLKQSTCDIDTSVQNCIILVRKGSEFNIIKNVDLNTGIVFEDAIMHIEPVIFNEYLSDMEYKKEELIKLLNTPDATQEKFKKKLDLTNKQYEKLMEIFIDIGIYA